MNTRLNPNKFDEIGIRHDHQMGPEIRHDCQMGIKMRYSGEIGCRIDYMAKPLA